MANVSGLNILSPRYPLKGRPMDARELDKIGAKGPLREFLARLSYPDQYFKVHEFDEDTINADYWALANSGGTSAADFAVMATTVQCGTIQGDTGTTDNGSISLVGPLIFKGDQNAGMHVRLKVDAVTGYNLEVGFIDAVPGSNGSGVSDVDTPAATATDAALLQIDTDQTLATLAFVTAGTSFTTTSTTLTTPITVLSAATYADVRIQLVANTAYCWVNGVLAASHTGSKIEGGTAVAPWIYARTRNTTAKFVDVDYIALWQDRV